MPTLGLQLQPGTLNNAQCWPSTPQALYAEMFEKGRALVGSLTGIIISETTPLPQDRDKGWIKTSSGHPIGIFVWDTVLNYWVYPNPEPPNSTGVNTGPIRWWRGTIASLATYDGGEAGAVSSVSGPMWELDADLNGRFPISPGTLASGTVIGIGDTGGNERVTLTLPNVPPHTHTVPLPQSSTAEGGNSGYLINVNSGTQQTGSAGGSGTPEVAQPFTVLPPYIGVYAIKRTARQYYRG